MPGAPYPLRGQHGKFFTPIGGFLALGRHNVTRLFPVPVSASDAKTPFAAETQFVNTTSFRNLISHRPLCFTRWSSDRPKPPAMYRLPSPLRNVCQYDW
jgi:hypothetical protein